MLRDWPTLKCLFRAPPLANSSCVALFPSFFWHGLGFSMFCCPSSLVEKCITVVKIDLKKKKKFQPTCFNLFISQIHTLCYRHKYTRTYTHTCTLTSYQISSVNSFGPHLFPSVRLVECVCLSHTGWPVSGAACGLHAGVGGLENQSSTQGSSRYHPLRCCY